MNIKNIALISVVLINPLLATAPGPSPEDTTKYKVTFKPTEPLESVFKLLNLVQEESKKNKLFGYAEEEISERHEPCIPDKLLKDWKKKNGKLFEAPKKGTLLENPIEIAYESTVCKKTMVATHVSIFGPYDRLFELENGPDSKEYFSIKNDWLLIKDSSPFSTGLYRNFDELLKFLQPYTSAPSKEGTLFSVGLEHSKIVSHKYFLRSESLILSNKTMIQKVLKFDFDNPLPEKLYDQLKTKHPLHEDLSYPAILISHFFIEDGSPCIMLTFGQGPLMDCQLNHPRNYAILFRDDSKKPTGSSSLKEKSK